MQNKLCSKQKMYLIVRHAPQIELHNANNAKVEV